MLEDGGHGHNRLALDALDQQVRVPHRKLGPARQHFLHRGNDAVAGQDGDVQPLVAVKPFGLRRVVARKLKLVQPLELQRHGDQWVTARAGVVVWRSLRSARHQRRRQQHRPPNAAAGSQRSVQGLEQVKQVGDQSHGLCATRPLHQQQDHCITDRVDGSVSFPLNHRPAAITFGPVAAVLSVCASPQTSTITA